VAESVRLAGVAKHPLILPSAPSTIRQGVDAAFLGEHFKYQLVAEVGATDIAVAIVETCLAHAILVTVGNSIRLASEVELGDALG
jgi:LysR family nitrogen assimilation transcriptional regulator